MQSGGLSPQRGPNALVLVVFKYAPSSLYPVYLLLMIPIQFSTTAAEPIRSNLTPRRGQSSSAQHHALPPRASLLVSSQSLNRTTTTTRQATPPPQPSSPPHTPTRGRPENTPFTPFRIVHSGTRPRAKDASPATQSLLVHTNTIFRVYLSTRNAFPDDNTIIQEVAAAFREACREASTVRRDLRFQKDPVYAEYVQDVVSCFLLMRLGLSHMLL